jgi:hypothetical protein
LRSRSFIAVLGINESLNVVSDTSRLSFKGTKRSQKDKKSNKRESELEFKRKSHLQDMTIRQKRLWIRNRRRTVQEKTFVVFDGREKCRRNA